MEKEQEQFEMYKELIETRIKNKNLEQANELLCEQLREKCSKVKKLEDILTKIEELITYED